MIENRHARNNFIIISKFAKLNLGNQIFAEWTFMDMTTVENPKGYEQSVVQGLQFSVFINSTPIIWHEIWDKRRKFQTVDGNDISAVRLHIGRMPSKIIHRQFPIPRWTNSMYNYTAKGAQFHIHFTGK